MWAAEHGITLGLKLNDQHMGTITQLHTHHYRNAPYGGWKLPIPADCDAQHVDWKTFQGEAAPHDFDPSRYMNWRFYWDYSGGTRSSSGTRCST